MKLLSALSLACSVLALSAPATAEADLTRTGGVLGDQIQYHLVGDPGQAYIFVPATSTGPTPLAVLDPGDPRVAGVGLELLNFVKFGPLDGMGEKTLTFALPASPGLAGLVVHAQMFTAPGVGTLVDELSSVNSVTLGASGDSYASIGGLPQSQAGFGAAALQDGRVALGGGAIPTVAGGTVATAAVRVFDGQTQAFEGAGVLPYQVINPAATRLADGRVLFSGGIDDTNLVLNRAAIWDPATQTSIEVGTMSTPRVQHTATLLADGRVFVTGGTSSVNATDPLASLSNILATSEIFDPTTGGWTPAASLPDPRIGHGATLLPSGRVLITGGLEVDFFFFPLPAIVNTARRYDPNTNQMLSAASFSGPRALHGQLTLSDGRVIVVGGADGDVLTQNFFSVATVRTYDETTNSWTNQPSLPEVRTFPNVVEANGDVHVLSGLSTIDVLSLTGTPVTTIARASLANLTWATVGALTGGRPLSQAHPVDGGDRIIVLGPKDATDLSADVYIP